jgi:uncharacterized protein (TIGR03435 family)
VNATQILFSQPWVEPLGWTLIHFVWQGFAIAALYAAARRGAARVLNPRLKYVLACAALTAMMAAPPATWALIRPSHAVPGDAFRIRSIPVSARSNRVAAETTMPAPSIPAAVPDVQLAEFLLWVVMVWLAGALVFWVRLMGGWVVAARMQSVSVRSAQPEWQDMLGNLTGRMCVSRPVRLLVSALVEAPTVIGWLRPVVLVPVGALGGLPVEYLEALLLHELAHIRRHDPLINILQSVAEALLFYHPAVWWVSGHIRADREMCCDDMAVAVSGDAFAYARALAEVESERPRHLSAVLAANGGSLSNRIARLLGQPKPTAGGSRGPGALALALLLFGATYGLLGQPDAHPRFQEASIKQNPFSWNERFKHPMGGGYRLGGRLVMDNASLLFLIQFAYAPHDNPMVGHSLPLLASQVVGGPPWINSVGYDIEAKPKSSTDPKRMRLMLETLLADRFKLALHKETREFPVYDLTVAQKGFRLPAAREVGCVSFPPGTTPRPIPGKVDCGYVAGPFGRYNGGRLHLEGSKLHMADLIRELAFVLDTPVMDETNFKGEFDLVLSFAADKTTVGLRALGGPGERGSKPPAGLPNISEALEEQLGLKLVAARAPVEILVVDHAERPVTN